MIALLSGDRDSAAPQSLITQGNAVGKWNTERGLLDSETHTCTTVLSSFSLCLLSHLSELWDTPAVPTSLSGEAFKAGLLGVGWLWSPDQQGSSFSASPSPGEEDVPQLQCILEEKQE